MKAGWEVRPIASFAKTGAGGTPKKGTEAFYNGGDVPWLLSGEVANANIIEAKNFITQEGLKGSSAKLFPAYSVLVAMYGATAGEVGILKFEAATNQAVCAVLPSDDHVPEFLYYYLLHAKPSLVAQAVGNAQPNISQAKIKALPIPLPPLEEQQRIVAVLDEAFEGLARARAHATANLQNARELFESFLGSVFEGCTEGWFSGTVGDAVSEGIIARPIDGNHGGTHPKKTDFCVSGVPFIMASDLKRGQVDQTGCYFLERSQADSLRKGFAKSGDILLSHKGTIGRVAMLNTELDYVMLTPQVTYYRVLDTDRLVPNFVFFLFQSATFLRAMKLAASEGATRAYIGITRQSDLPFRFPNIDDQKRLIKEFERVRDASMNSVAHYQTKLQDLDDLRQSLLRKAFAGELT